MDAPTLQPLQRCCLVGRIASPISRVLELCTEIPRLLFAPCPIWIFCSLRVAAGLIAGVPLLRLDMDRPDQNSFRLAAFRWDVGELSESLVAQKRLPGSQVIEPKQPPNGVAAAHSQAN